MPRVFGKRHTYVSHLAWPALMAVSLTTLAAQPAKKISFPRDVAPILTQKCMNCHGREPLMAHLDLRTRDGALKGAQHGPGVVPGNAAGSHLYRRLTGEEQPPMPWAAVLPTPKSRLSRIGSIAAPSGTRSEAGCRWLRRRPLRRRSSPTSSAVIGRSRKW